MNFITDTYFELLMMQQLHLIDTIIIIIAIFGEQLRACGMSTNTLGKGTVDCHKAKL